MIFIAELSSFVLIFFFFFNDTATTEIYTLSLHDALPIGILGSLVVCTGLYVAVAFVLTGIVPYDRLNVPDPIAVGIDAVGMRWLAPIVKLGAILGLTSVILVMLLGQARVLYAMAHDGLLPPVASRVHRRFHTPYLTTIGTGTVV